MLALVRLALVITISAVAAAVALFHISNLIWGV